MTRWLLVLAITLPPAAAQVCGQHDIYGAYGVQLSGTSTISTTPQPMANLARLVFDWNGGVTGYSSVNFNGYFLGNPVTGTFELKTDCTLTWKLQDDSGAFQNFRGTVRPGGASADIRQTDPGANGRGSLKKTPTDCSDSTFRGNYLFAMIGTPTPFATDGAGKLTPAREGKVASYHVDSDCFVQIQMDEMKLRGILVDNGREVFAIQTDPQQVTTARFVAQ